MDPLAALKLLPPTLALISTGYGISASHNTLPALYPLPARTSTPLFAHTFRVGGSLVVPLTLTSTLTSFLLAYCHPDQRNLWMVAGGCSLATLPWTRGVMIPGIRRLIRISEDKGACEVCEGTGEHVGLLKSWTWQNYVRSGMFFVAGGLGLWGMLTS